MSYPSVGLISTSDVSDVVGGALSAKVAGVDQVGKDDFATTYAVTMEDGRAYTFRATISQHKVLESEIATMMYLAEKTSIPVPKIIASGSLPTIKQVDYFFYEKPLGTSLDTTFAGLSNSDQSSIVKQLASWMLELFTHRFPSIGSLTKSPPSSTDEKSESEYTIGPIVSRPFYIESRGSMALDRGPFPSSKAYYRGCANRELDACRSLFAQDAGSSYQEELERSQMQVERAVGLLCDLVNKCEGLDDDDPDYAPFSLDIHDIGLKSIIVSSDTPSNIIAILDWKFICTRPLWCCARLPSWLRPSMFSNPWDCQSLTATFCSELSRADTNDASLFLQVIGADSTRNALDDLADYDALQDGFILLPALENILATIPGKEDVEGLSALLDPSTLPGRVARINLITRGSKSMLLGMSQLPKSPNPASDTATSERPKVFVPTRESVMV